MKRLRWLLVLVPLLALCVFLSAVLLARVPWNTERLTGNVPYIGTSARTPAVSPVPLLARPTEQPVPLLARTTAHALHIRTGPGIRYTVIGWLRAGDNVEILACQNGWAKIQQGWINANFIDRQCGDYNAKDIHKRGR